MNTGSSIRATASTKQKKQTNMEATLILKDGSYAIYKTNAVYGGTYSVVNHANKTAKIGLCLDAAFDLFSELTLEAKLKENGLIES